MAATIPDHDLQIIAAWSGHDPAQVAADPRLHELGRLLITDPLTGLYNRRYFLARLDLELAAGAPLTVGILDLDGFKRVNDTLGHERGDAVLRACAEYLRARLPGALVARLGGDECALLFPGQPAAAVALTLGPVLTALPEGLGLPDLGTPLQASVGLAAHPADGSTGPALLRAADAAMYWAKRERRGRLWLAGDLGETTSVGDPRTAILMAPLVGREAVWGRLSARLTAATGRGGIICLEGATGAGKSRLLQELTESAARSGWRTLSVHPGLQSGPYRPFELVLGRLPGGDAAPRRRGSTPYREAAAQVRRLLQAADGGPPLCIAVDDLQAALPTTWLVLDRLGPELDRRSLLILATIRSGPDTEPFWEALRSQGSGAGWLVSETIAGLDPSGTRALAHALLGGAISTPIARTLHRATGGNPLHATQVLKAWLSSGVLIPGPTGWTRQRDREAQAPGDLIQALFWRVGQLEPEVRETLGLGAVLGDQFRRADVAALSGAAPEQVGAWLDGALQAQMVVEAGGDSLRFAHPLLREAAYAGLSPQTRRLAHRVAGHLLEEAGGAPPSELARHFDAAGVVQRAQTYHVHAGDQAVAAFDQSAARHHFRRAGELQIPAGLPLDADWARLALKKAAAAQVDGDPRAAAVVCRDSLRHRAGLPQPLVLALLLQSGEASRLAGNTAEAEAAHAEAAALLTPEATRHDRLQVRTLGLRLQYGRAMSPAHLDEAMALAAEAHSLGEHVLAGSLYSLASAVLVQLHRAPEATALNRRALALLPVGSSPDAVIVRLRAALGAETVAAARRGLLDALHATTVVGDLLARARLLRLLGNLDRGAGRWGQALRYYDESLQLARRQGSEVERDRTMHERGMLMAWQGQTEAGGTLISAAAAAAAARGDRMTVVACRGRLAFCQMAAGRPDAALAALFDLESFLPPENVVAQYLCYVQALAWLQAGDRAAAAGAVAVVRDVAPPFEGMALRAWVLGSLALAEGDPAGALRWFAELRTLADRPFVERYWLAWARFEEAVALRRLGQEATAARRLGEARRSLRHLGAPAALEQVAQYWRQGPF